MNMTSQTQDSQVSLHTLPQGLAEAFSRDNMNLAHGTAGPVLVVNPGYYSGPGPTVVREIRTPPGTNAGSTQQ